MTPTRSTLLSTGTILLIFQLYWKEREQKRNLAIFTRSDLLNKEVALIPFAK